jgi:hypothetical protein
VVYRCKEDRNAKPEYRVESLMEHGVVLTYPFKVAVPFEELTE